MGGGQLGHRLICGRTGAQCRWLVPEPPVLVTPGCDHLVLSERRGCVVCVCESGYGGTFWCHGSLEVTEMAQVRWETFTSLILLAKPSPLQEGSTLDRPH